MSTPNFQALLMQLPTEIRHMIYIQGQIPDRVHTCNETPGNFRRRFRWPNSALNLSRSYAFLTNGIASMTGFAAGSSAVFPLSKSLWEHDQQVRTWHAGHTHLKDRNQSRVFHLLADEDKYGILLALSHLSIRARATLEHHPGWNHPARAYLSDHIRELEGIIQS